MSNNKTTIAIASILMITIAVTLVALPQVKAHDPPWTVKTYTYVGVTPNPVGVNQQVFIFFWLDALPPTTLGAYGDRWTFYVDITLPDSSEKTLGPFTSDPVGGSYTTYTPNQVGTYTFVARMIEHKITGLPLPPGETIDTIGGAEYVNDTYQASSSDPVDVVVQETAIQPWAETPLPSQYWTRPINGANRDWYVLAANWLAGAAQNVGPTTQFSYGTGPESAHVMWSTPMWAGGIMDARFGDIGYATEHYEGIRFLPPIILNGRIYYNVLSLPREGWYCLNLYTGEVEYFHNTTGPVTGIRADWWFPSGSIAGEALAFGQIYDYESPNQHGGMPYLWSTSGPDGTWMMFDAFTGNYICSVGNVSSDGTPVYGKDGSILYYNIVDIGAEKYLQVWNTSRAIWYKPDFSSNEYWMWRPGLAVIYDGNNGFSLNASIPDLDGSIITVREDQYVIGGTAGSNDENGVVQGSLWALNLEPASDGTITPTKLWDITFSPPSSEGNKQITMGTVDPEDGVFVFWCRQTRQWWGYSLETGQQLWGPTEPEPDLNFYNDLLAASNVYEGKLLSAGLGGVLTAYDIKTGDVLWNYTASNYGFESPYGNYPLLFTSIADGKIYLTSGEHSPTQPLWRGGHLHCINASNGVELWKIMMFNTEENTVNTVMADGYVVGLNYYDNQIYCFGKGPSGTTVTASPKVSVHGDDVLIEGIVTDQSVGAKKIAEKEGFVNGVPAVSDESMEVWMEWLYQQQAKPKNATGVEVVLETLDPNGNFYEIGKTTSDANGMFSYAFTPEVPGLYTIVATFEGSSGYYGSQAETAITVSEAPQASPTPTPPPPTMTDTYVIGFGTAMIIMIAVIGALLLLRKR